MAKLIWRASPLGAHDALANSGNSIIALIYTGFGRYEIRINGVAVESVEGLELAKRRAIHALTR